jgi:TPR repeat protein
MNALGRDGVVDLDLAFDEREPDRNRLHAADALVLTDPERALREYQDLANLGSAMSLLALGLMYERGQGTALDVSKSFEYYSLASEKGSVLFGV